MSQMFPLKSDLSEGMIKIAATITDMFGTKSFTDFYVPVIAGSEESEQNLADSLLEGNAADNPDQAIANVLLLSQMDVSVEEEALPAEDDALLNGEAEVAVIDTPSGPADTPSQPASPSASQPAASSPGKSETKPSAPKQTSSGSSKTSTAQKTATSQKKAVAVQRPTVTRARAPVAAVRTPTPVVVVSAAEKAKQAREAAIKRARDRALAIQKAKDEKNKKMMEKFADISSAKLSPATMLTAVKAMSGVSASMDKSADPELMSKTASVGAKMAEKLENMDDMPPAAKEEALNSIMSTLAATTDMSANKQAEEKKETEAKVEAAAAKEEDEEEEEDDEPVEEDPDAVAAQEAAKKAEEKKQADAAGSCVAGMAAAGRAVAKALPLGGKKYIGQPKLGVLVSKSLGAHAGDISTYQGDMDAKLGDTIADVGGANATVATQSSGSSNNFYGYKPSPVTSGLMIMYLKDENNNDLAVDGAELDVELKSDADDAGVELNTTELNVDADIGMVYTQFNITSNGTGLVLNLRPALEGTQIDLFINFAANLSNKTDRPTLDEHDYHISLPKREKPKWQYFVGAEDAEPGVALIGIVHAMPWQNLTLKTRRRQRRAAGGADNVFMGGSHVNETIARAFTMKTLLSTCRYFDTNEQEWTSKGCSVVDGTTANVTKCKCSKITSNVRTFGGGSMIPAVNPINFANVFANFGALLAENSAVFATIVAMLICYFIVLVWTRRMDKKDLAKWGVRPLADNHPLEVHHYQLTIETGMRGKAQTESAVSFALSGAEGETGVRRLTDGEHDKFDRGSVCYFMMTTNTSLGDLNYLRIWHDNKGKGSNASWYLTKVTVEDLFTGRKFHFLVDDWLAVDEGDGQLDRVVPVAGDEQLKSFNHLFFASSKKNMSDSHLWVSVLVRPTKSPFTRAQRWTCCVSLLATTMISNAMWYQPVEGPEQVQALHFGPITLTVDVLYVGAMSALMIVPTELILTTMFRKSRPKNYAPPADELAEADRDLSEMSLLQVLKFKILQFSRQRYFFPHWFVWFAWMFAFITIIVPCFFVILYSLEWGRERSEGWLGALFVSVIQTIVLVQPIKIILMAFLVSVFLKKLEEDDAELKNNTNNATPDEDEELDKVYAKITAPVRESAPPPPPAGLELARQRDVRQKENHMYSICWEMALYWFYLLLMSFIAWGSVDFNVFNANDVFKKHYQGGLPAPIHLNQVVDGFKFYDWVFNVLADNSYYDVDYRYMKVDKANRKYASNLVGYRVTNPRLRQLRVPPDECKDTLSDTAKRIVGAWGCQESYSLFSQEERDFGANWAFQKDGAAKKDKYTRIEKAFRWQSALDLKGIPTTGTFATYSGGGYIADLGKTRTAAHKMVGLLMHYNWIDTHTRAIFAEFTAYNPSANLFTFCMYLFEFPSVGGIRITETVKSYRLYEGSGFDSIMTVAQVIFIMHLFYYTWHESVQFRKGGRMGYLKDPWNWLDITVIMLSYLAVIMTILQKIILAVAVDDLAAGESTLNFDTLMTYVEQLTNVVGILVFLATCKFLRLLRFNRMMCMLLATIRFAAWDLFNMFFVFSIAFIAYAFFAYGIFITHVESLNSFVRVCENQFQMMLGKFDFTEMMASQPVIAPFYFFTYQFFVFFILMNMFITIISMGFIKIRKNPHKADLRDVEFPDFVAGKLKKAVKPGRRDKRMGIGFVTMDDVLDRKLRVLDQQVNENVRSENQSRKSKRTRRNSLGSLALAAAAKARARAFPQSPVAPTKAAETDSISIDLQLDLDASQNSGAVARPIFFSTDS